MIGIKKEEFDFLLYFIHACFFNPQEHLGFKKAEDFYAAKKKAVELLISKGKDIVFNVQKEDYGKAPLFDYGFLPRKEWVVKYYPESANFPIKIKKIIRTSSECPSQWDLETEDGKWVYVRFRNGFFYASIGDTIDEAVGSLGREAIYLMDAKIGEYLYGCMSIEEMKEVTNCVLDFSESGEELDLNGERYKE